MVGDSGTPYSFLRMMDRERTGYSTTMEVSGFKGYEVPDSGNGIYNT